MPIDGEAREERYDRIDVALRGALAGLIGSIVMGSVGIVVAALKGPSFAVPMSVIAASAIGGGSGGELIVVGSVLHMIVGGLFGSVFALLLPRGARIPVILGASLVYGLALHLAMALLVAQLGDRGEPLVLEVVGELGVGQLDVDPAALHRDEARPLEFRHQPREHRRDAFLRALAQVQGPVGSDQHEALGARLQVGLGLLGLEVPTDVEGLSHKTALLADPEPPVRTEVYTTKTYHDSFDPIRAIRTKEYSYIENYASRPLLDLPWDIADSAPGRIVSPLVRAERPPRELYDLRTEPAESNNLLDPGGPDEAEAIANELALLLIDTYEHYPAPQPAA